MQKFNYANFVFDYEPYPIGIAREFIEPDYYRRLVENFPSIEIFRGFFDAGSNKKVLSELYAPNRYHRKGGKSLKPAPTQERIEGAFRIFRAAR